jgi:hypothetical protein
MDSHPEMRVFKANRGGSVELEVDPNQSMVVVYDGSDYSDQPLDEPTDLMEMSARDDVPLIKRVVHHHHRHVWAQVKPGTPSIVERPEPPVELHLEEFDGSHIDHIPKRAVSGTVFEVARPQTDLKVDTVIDFERQRPEPARTVETIEVFNQEAPMKSEFSSQVSMIETSTNEAPRKKRRMPRSPRSISNETIEIGRDFNFPSGSPY